MWSTAGAPTFTVVDGGQLAWAEHDDEHLTDHEERRSPHGDHFTLRQVWSRDRSRLQRCVIEGAWANGPMVFAEVRRPAGGWRGDEVGRLVLAVLSCGMLSS